MLHRIIKDNLPPTVQNILGWKTGISSSCASPPFVFFFCRMLRAKGLEGRCGRVHLPTYFYRFFVPSCVHFVVVLEGRHEHGVIVFVANNIVNVWILDNHFLDRSFRLFQFCFIFLLVVTLAVLKTYRILAENQKAVLEEYLHGRGMCCSSAMLGQHLPPLLCGERGFFFPWRLRSLMLRHAERILVTLHMFRRFFVAFFS